MRPRTLILLLLLVPSQVFSQEAWSLEQCISYALENNIQLKQQELNVRMDENALLQSRYSIYPSVNAHANHSYNFGRAIDYLDNTVSQDLESSSFSISSSATLFNGFRITNTRKQNQINLMATLSDVEKLRNDLSLNIASAYLQILYSIEVVETSQQQLDLSHIQVQRTRTLVDAGSLAVGSLLEIEAQLASDELQLVNAQNQLDMAYLNLVQMLDIKTTEGFAIEKPNLDELVTSPPVETADAIFNTALEVMPQIQSANHRLASSEMGLEVAKGGRYPTLSINGSYGSGARRYLESNPLIENDPFFAQIRDNASTSIGLTLSIPIFNGLQVRSSISNASIGMDYARLNLELERSLLYKDIQQAYTDAFASHKKYEATGKSLKALELAFQHSEQKFNLGLLTSLDYITSRTRLAQAEADLLAAKYEFIFKTKILDFYRGTPITL